jgi:hypothetical protein
MAYLGAGLSRFNTADKLTVTGTAEFNSTITATTDDNNPQLIITSTDADAAVGPVLDMIRDSASPADNDTLGRIRFRGDNDAGEVFTYGTITSKITDASDGTEGGLLTFLVGRNGSVTSALDLNETETVFNEGSLDADFRVESDGNSHMFFLDAGNNTVGIGTDTATNPLTVRGTGGTGATAALRFRDENDQGATFGVFNSGNVVFNAEQGNFFLNFAGTEKFTFESGGDLDIDDGNLKVASGHGINFAATANSAGSMSNELLDDYEEGSWTPTFTTNSGNAASGSVSGRYTKIGRTVFVTANINNINTSGTTGGSILRIHSLPFTCDGLSMHGAVTADNVTFQGSRTQITALFSTGDLVQFPQTGTGSGDTPTDHNDISSGVSDILFSGVYFSDQ